MKSLFLWLHRWFGLIAGFYFILLGLSGSYLVYDDLFDSLIQSDLRASSGHSNSFSLSALLETAQRGLMTEKVPQRISIPEKLDANAIVSFNFSTGKERKMVNAFVDLSSGEYKGSVSFGESLTGMVFRFHHDLFLGSLGKTIVAVAGLILLALLLTGLYLWWPTKKAGLRKALTLREIKNLFLLNYEFHRLAGFYTLILMLLVTATGVVIARPDWFSDRQQRAERPADASATTSISFDIKALDSALQQEGLQVRPLALGFDEKKGLVKIRSSSGGQDVAFEFDAKSSKIRRLDISGNERKSFRNQNFDLHSGRFWGAMGSILIFISGLLPLFFYVSGFYIWWKKSRKVLR